MATITPDTIEKAILEYLKQQEDKLVEMMKKNGATGSDEKLHEVARAAIAHVRKK